MKYLLFALSTLLLVTSCARTDTPVTTGSDTPKIVVSKADTSTDAKTDTTADISKESDLQDNSGDAKETESKESDTVGVEQKNAKLQVDDQRTSGQITIKNIATSRDGWVSIHKSRADGSIQQPENIGEARVDSGNSENTIVDLWEAPAVGDKLWALLHIDAGERGLYEYPGTDVPVKNNGETMARSFVIQGEKKDKAESAEQ